MMKIAIVFYDEIESYDYEGYGRELLIASRITEWEEVTDEEYHILTRNQTRGKKRYMVISAPENTREFIEHTVKEVLDRLRKEQQEEENRKKAAEQKKLEAKAKRLAKDEAARKALYEKLKSEFE